MLRTLYLCALTLAAKLKLGTKRKVFQRFGKALAFTDSNGQILASMPNPSLAKTNKFSSNATLAAFCTTR
jgi:hypothetical protein